jgi:hypothetical protein
MMTAPPVRSSGGARRYRQGGAEILGVSEWLSLAAAPTFAVMALLTALGGSPMDRLCSTVPATPLSGMALMYLIMSTFHTPPWLKLIFRCRGAPIWQGDSGESPTRHRHGLSGPLGDYPTRAWICDTNC